MYNKPLTVRQIDAEIRRRYKTSAASVNDSIRQGIKQRAIEAVQSGEPHKVTGGWVILPFQGQHEIRGLLHLATESLRAAQLANFYAS